MSLKTCQFVKLDYFVRFEYLPVFMAIELFPVSTLLFLLLLLLLHPSLWIVELSQAFFFYPHKIFFLKVDLQTNSVDKEKEKERRKREGE